MRAVAIYGFGDVDQLRVIEMDAPTPGPGEVAVRVRAASLNHLDVWVRQGRASGPMPHVLGSDAAGTVVALGEGVRDLAVGDDVLLYPALGCGQCAACFAGEVPLCEAFRIIGAGAPGVYRDVAVAPAGCWVKKPASVSFEAAACLAVNFLTAWHMVVARGRARPGETALITGVGGGVAVAALQIAKLAGLRVIVTSSSDAKLERARALGADEGIHYAREDVGAKVRAYTEGRGVELVLDSAGEATYATNLAALRKGGRLVHCGVTTGANPPADLRQAYLRQLSVIGSTLGSRAELAEVLALVAGGRLRAQIDAVYPLEEIREATSRMERGDQFGKLVLSLG